MYSWRFKALTILLALIAPIASFALEVNSSVLTDQVWKRGDSPIDVTALIQIGRDVKLTIEPGVTIQFSRDAGIIVLGDLVAEGSETSPILFTSIESEQPGSWGGVFFRNADSPKAFNEDYTATGQGSRLVYCQIENGGNPEVENGSVLGFRSASPYIANTTIRNSTGQTGTIRCLNSSSPLFINCRIEGNVSTRGGALSSSIGSKPHLVNCFIIGNEARDNGGAIYVSLADARLIRCIVNGNRAGSDGGAIFAARSSDLTLTENVFEGNRAATQSNILFLSDQIGAKISGNTFEAVGTVIWLLKVPDAIDASGNYWGNPSEVNFREIIRDRNDDATEALVKYEPALFAPSFNTPVNPGRIDKIALCRDDSYSENIPRGVADGAPLRIRLDGEDPNPGFADLITVLVKSESNPEGILIPLRETGANTGIYTGRGVVAKKSDQKTMTIGSVEGGKVTISSPVNPDYQAQYNTLTPRPIAENLAIANVGDINHLTDHLPQFSWGYYEPVDRPQKSFKLKVTTANGAGVWQSGDIKSDATSMTYAGEPLEDGESYIFEIVVNSGKFWSEPSTLSFRMNSLPTAPQPLRPSEAALITTRSPQVAIGISSDRENDELTYSFEIENTTGGSDRQEISGLKGTDEVVWTPAKQLEENSGYRFRAHANDPFEPGEWGDYRLFYVNSLEEAPLAFNLSDPNNIDVSDLHPTLSWVTAIDPDPLSNVVYSVEIAKNGNWSAGRKYDNLISTSYQLPDSLDNKSEYTWRVTATDNTGRKTVSSPGKFRVDTTPSNPTLIAPLSREERKPEAVLAWNASTDPNPQDVLTYEIEVFKDAAQPKVLASKFGWSGTEIAINELQGGELLADNSIYQWRVKARDNHNAASEFSTAGSFFNNCRNDTPTPPAAVISPAALTTGTTTVTFGWQAGSDADLSDGLQTLIYEIEAVVGSFESGDIRRFRSGGGETELSAALDDNKVWKYRLRTVDDDGAASPWTTTKETLVNFQEDSPAPFTLLNPASGETIVELDSLRLFWALSSDPDWNSSIKYRLELTGQDGKAYKYETSGSEWLHKSALTNESSYSWKVTAIDNTGRETICNSEFSFHTNTTPSIPTTMAMPLELLPNGKLTWGSSTDPNPRDRLLYTIDISSNDGFSPIIVHKEGIPNAAGSIAVTINELAGWDKLQDDRDYLFRVKAVDNHGFQSAWSSPVKFRFNLANDAPTSPGAPFDPTADRTITERSPTLKWSQSTDEDLSDPTESLIYEIRLDADGELTKSALYEFSALPGATEFRIPMPLNDNTPWIWAVRAKDDGGAVSGWSPAQSFLLNVHEDAPTPPFGIKPFNGQTLNILGPISTGWTRSVDPDYKSSVSYRVEYGVSPNLEGATKSGDLKDSTFTIQGPLENTTYYWRVIARDNTGLESVSNTNSFILDTRPTVPQPAMPGGGVEFKPDGRFAFGGSVDPNPTDQIIYKLQIAADNGFGTIAAELTGLKETTALANAPGIKGKLTDNTRYYWRVKAIDNHKIESAWSSTAEFTYNEKNDPPSQFSLLKPENGSLNPQGEIQLGWSLATDPDPGSRVVYTLLIARDAKFSDRTQRFTGLPTGEFTIPPTMIEAGATYYWRVTAEDGLGGISHGSNSDKTPWNFQIQAPPPPPDPTPTPVPTPTPAPGN